MSEFWENSCWSCPSFYPYISLDRCAQCMRVCVCVYVSVRVCVCRHLFQHFVLCVFLYCITHCLYTKQATTRGKMFGMLLKQKKTDDLQVIQIHCFIEGSTHTTYQTLTLKCHVCFWFCAIIYSFVVFNTPDTVNTRDEDFEQSPGEARSVLLLHMNNVTCLCRAIRPFPPKHTLRFSA